MRRLILLAIGLSALLWATGARTGSASASDIIAMSGAGSCPHHAAESHGPRPSDHQWDAQHHTIAATSESRWKSAPVHAALAAARSPLAFEPARAIGSPDPPGRSAPHYLRHTPLLI